MRVLRETSLHFSIRREAKEKKDNLDILSNN